jgi:signal transduction histidine kinase
VKFTPECRRIELRSDVEDETLVTSVRDTGIGIATEDHARIFDKFHQVGATTKGVREGTGLGLAITNREANIGAHYSKETPRAFAGRSTQPSDAP